MPAVVRLAEKQDVALAKDILQGICPPPADRVIRFDSDGKEAFAQFESANAQGLIPAIRLCQIDRLSLRFEQCHLDAETKAELKKACEGNGRLGKCFFHWAGAAVAAAPPAVVQLPVVERQPPVVAPRIMSPQPPAVEQLQPPYSLQRISLPVFSPRVLQLVKPLNQLLELRASVEELKDCTSRLEHHRADQHHLLTKQMGTSSYSDLLDRFTKCDAKFRQLELEVCQLDFFNNHPSPDQVARITKREQARRELIAVSRTMQKAADVVHVASEEGDLKLAIESSKQRVQNVLEAAKPHVVMVWLLWLLPAWLAAYWFAVPVPFVNSAADRDESNKRRELEAQRVQLDELMRRCDLFGQVDNAVLVLEIEERVLGLVTLAQFHSQGRIDQVLANAIRAMGENPWTAMRKSLPQVDADLHHDLLQRPERIRMAVQQVAELKKEYQELKRQKLKSDLQIIEEPDHVRKQQLTVVGNKINDKMQAVLGQRDALYRQVQLESQSACLEFTYFPEHVNAARWEWEGVGGGVGGADLSQCERAKRILLHNHLLLPQEKSQFDHSKQKLPPAMRTLLDSHPKVKFATLIATEEQFLWKKMVMGTDLEREIQKLRRGLLLSRKTAHKSILACEGGLVFDDEVWLQFRFMAGGDLKYWSEQKPNRSFGCKLDVLAPIADALCVLHEHKVYHRDIKPQNICLDSDRDEATGKLIDFESSKEQESFSSHTMNSSATGSLGFMAPELRQLPGRAQASKQPDLARCDVYSFAATVVVVLALDCRYSAMEYDAMETLLAHRATFEQHPQLFDLLKRALGAARERPLMAEMSRVLNKRVCVINGECNPDTLCFQDGGVRCPSGEHFCCHADFAAHVHHACASGLQHDEGVPCAGEKCKLFYLTKDMGIANADLVYKALMQRLNAQTDIVVERRVRDEVKEQMALGLVAMHEREITSNILNRRCPSCSQVFLDFTACCALSCSRCPTKFCAFCLGGASANAHEHVRQCAENPKRGDYFCDEATYNAQQLRRKKRLVQAYLQSIHDPAIREQVRRLREVQLYL